MCPPRGFVVCGEGDGTARNGQLAAGRTAATESWRFVRHGPRLSAGASGLVRGIGKGGMWPVACGPWLWRVVRYPAVGADPCVRPYGFVVRGAWCGVAATIRPWLAARIRQSLPPLGEGRGGGFETGLWLVARSLWKYHDSPASACLARSIQATYHVLRTTYYVQFTYPTSYTPPPTYHALCTAPCRRGLVDKALGSCIKPMLPC